MENFRKKDSEIICNTNYIKMKTETPAPQSPPGAHSLLSLASFCFYMSFL